MSPAYLLAMAYNKNGIDEQRAEGGGSALFNSRLASVEDRLSLFSLFIVSLSFSLLFPSKTLSPVGAVLGGAVFGAEGFIST